MNAGPMTSIAVRLTGLAAGYGTPLWTGLDLQVAAGEFLAVLGGNGTGKTTLLRVLLGQQPAMTGRAEVLGARPRRGNPRVGYVPQLRAFDPDLPLRGVDLVRLGLDGHRWGIARPSRRARDQVHDALAAAGAAEYAHLPIGQVSGGQQQRLRIAQALVAAPDLVLADEPLLSLDPASQQQVTRLLDAHRGSTGSAVLVVTHDVNPVLPYADRVLYLAGGRWAVGTPHDVLTSTTLSRLYRSPVDVVRLRDQLLIVAAPVHRPRARAGV
jgi:zinc/manganese transport system ATP-binding protein